MNIHLRMRIIRSYPRQWDGKAHMPAATYYVRINNW